MSSTWPLAHSSMRMLALRLIWLLSVEASAWSLVGRPHLGTHAPAAIPQQQQQHRMQFGWGKPKPPAPPPPPVTIPSTVLVRRDLLPYGALIALGLAPVFDWASLGPDAVNAARLAYYLAIAIGTVYLGTQRQDLGASSPIGEKQAALAPVFASFTLGGLYLLIKCAHKPRRTMPHQKEELLYHACRHRPQPGHPLQVLRVPLRLTVVLRASAAPCGARAEWRPSRRRHRAIRRGEGGRGDECRRCARICHRTCPRDRLLAGPSLNGWRATAAAVCHPQQLSGLEHHNGHAQRARARILHLGEMGLGQRRPLLASQASRK